MLPLPFIVLALFFDEAVPRWAGRLLEGVTPGPIVDARRIFNLGSRSRGFDMPATLTGRSGSCDSID